MIAYRQLPTFQSSQIAIVLVLSGPIALYGVC